MTNKHFGWHKNWRREGNKLIHTSGIEFEAIPGDGFTDINVVKDTLYQFQQTELTRGVPVHDLVERLKRLNREAVEWHNKNKIN